MIDCLTAGVITRGFFIVTKDSQRIRRYLYFLCGVLKKSQMPKPAHIYVYGDIYNEQSEFAKDYGIVSLSTVVDQLNANPDAKEIIVHIHSRGGDVVEGFAIHDVLVNSGKKVTTHIEGLCASIATVIALAGTTRKMNANSEFFIHNPWADPFSMNGFTADDYAEKADQIRVAEDRLLDFYTGKTGGDRESLSAMMKEETSMTSAQALELKFITEIVETVNAFASLGISKQKQTDMKNSKKAESLIDRAMKFLQGKGDTIVNLDMTMKDGTKVTVETDEAEPAVGDAFLINGEPAPDGNHEMEDGTVISTAGGAITEIKKVEAADATEEEGAAGTDDAAALKAKIVAHEATIANLTAANTKLTSDIAAADATAATLNARIVEVVAMAKKVSSEFNPDKREFTGGSNKNNNSTEKGDVASRVAARVKALEDAKKAK